MKVRIVVFAIVLGLLLASPALATEKYLIDPVHTFVGFAARHLMVSTVRGHFGEFSGEILYDSEDITKSSVSVTIKTASVNTGVERRDNDLRSAGFLNAAQFPEITFKSKRVEKRGDAYVAIGDLTIRDVTKEIALPFTLSGPVAGFGGRKRIGTESEITINRHDYGVNWNNMLEGGGLIVGPEIRITLNVEAAQAPPEPEPQP